jgi:hypothetical protein
MNSENRNFEENLKTLMSKSLLTIPDRNFEDRVMEKVLLAKQMKTQRNKNLKLSWLFILLSAVLFPLGFIAILHNADYSFRTVFENASITSVQVFIPATIIIFAVIILIQIDNLLGLTFRMKTL